MPKLTRYLQKIFANNSDQVGVFGTGVDKETSKNVETLQSADYENGWSSAIITNKNYPIWQEMDGVQYGLSYQLKYLFQNGIPEWISTETYYTNQFCVFGGYIYQSLQDNNINHNPALNDGYWIVYSSVSDDRLHALKCYLDEGELLTDTEGLADVKNYAHSTFDRSKFTVVGSPNITDDGIAITGRSTSNVIRINSLNIPTNSEVEISFRYDYLATAAGYNKLLNAFSTTDGVDIFTLSLDWTNNGFIFKNNIDDTPEEKVAIQVGESYDVKITTDMVSYLKLYLNGELKITLSITNAFPTIERINIGNDNTPQPWFGENNPIDLKQFSIAVDGVEVFNGNKTGIDTIKPDNYTVVGTPTISADGVASGFSSSNYLNTGYLLDTSKPWTIYTGKVRINNTSVLQTILCSSYKNDASSDNTPILVSVLTNGKLRIMLSSTNDFGNSEADIANAIAGTATILTNTDYYFKLEFDGSKYILSYSTDGVNYTADITINDSTPVGSGYIFIGTRLFVGIIDNPLLGSIDLNAFKIYVDGNLVYQPCLKIPYTESKTGSKIVQSVYRDRVNDMYEQFGYAPYYTLSDTDFTLPQGEIYGMHVNKGELAECQVVVETYQNGTSWYRVYSDGWCEQGGQIDNVSSSQITVSLLKNYMNTNYSIQKTIGGKNASFASADLNDNYYGIWGITTSSFTTSTVNSVLSGHFMWQACGYIA